MGENIPVEIIDTHMHLWSPRTHPWIDKVRRGGHPAGKFEGIATYLLEDYLKDIEGYNVTHIVHVEAAWPGDPVGETNWLDGIADSNADGYPQGHCDLSKLVEAEDILSRHVQSNHFRGVRQMLNYHNSKPVYSEAPHDNYLTDTEWLRGIALLEKFGLSFEMHVLPSQMARAAEVTRQFPGVQFMINHCGLPYERDIDTMKTWREGLTNLACLPNVYCKVSGMFATDQHWTQKTVADVVQPVLDIFGMDSLPLISLSPDYNLHIRNRCVFASNFPVDRINGTFPQLITVLSNILQPYTEDEKHKFFSGNGRKFYRL